MALLQNPVEIQAAAEFFDEACLPDQAVEIIEHFLACNRVSSLFERIIRLMDMAESSQLFEKLDQKKMNNLMSQTQTSNGSAPSAPAEIPLTVTPS